MSTERQRILEMLEEGTIDAQQATALLDALSAGEAPAVEDEVIHPETPPENLPNMDRYRGWWRYPFIVAVSLLVFSAMGLSAIYANAGRVTFGFVCLWSFFMLMALVALLAFWSRLARWIHVRIRSKDGSRLAISLPVPLKLARIGIDIASGYVKPDVADHLELAETLIDVMEGKDGEMDAAQMLVDIDDDDGDSVQVYFG